MTTLPLFDRRTAVYRLFGTKDELLYVGISCNPPSRFKVHRRDKAWWPSVTKSAIEWHDNRLAALRCEASAIQIESPIHNQQRPEPSQIFAPAPPVPPRTDLPGMSFEQAAKRLGGAVGWLRKGVKAGQLNHHCNESDVWFTDADLHHIIAKCVVLERSASPERIAERDLGRHRAHVALTQPGCRHTA